MIPWCAEGTPFVNDLFCRCDWQEGSSNQGNQRPRPTVRNSGKVCMDQKWGISNHVWLLAWPENIWRSHDFLSRPACQSLILVLRQETTCLSIVTSDDVETRNYDANQKEVHPSDKYERTGSPAMAKPNVDDEPICEEVWSRLLFRNQRVEDG